MRILTKIDTNNVSIFYGEYMKKLSIIILFIICFTFIACKENISDTGTDIVEESKTDYASLKDEELVISNFEIDQIPYVFLEKLERLSSFKKHTVGSTTAKIIIKYTQTIDSLYIKNDEEKHLVTNSNSTLVNVYHEAYYERDYIRYRESTDNDFTSLTRDEYKDIYGVILDEARLEGFILNSDTILEVSKIDSEEYNVYQIIIDGNLAGAEAKKQMKEYGNLSSLPEFSYVCITITIEDDFTPVKIDFVSDYKITLALLGSGNCHQEYEVTYSDIIN